MVSTIQDLGGSVGSWFTAATARGGGGGGFIEHELATNKLLRGVREVEALREVLLSAVSKVDEGTEAGADVHLLVPQSVTLDEVEVTPELVETHLVLLQRSVPGQPRGFRSLNGLCGTWQPDDTLVVHGRRPRAAGSSNVSWNFGARGTVPQLESQIHILREAQLQAAPDLPLRVPLPLLLISDPLFYPGCGWKLSLALDLVTHRFAKTELDTLGLADVPQLLFEYQILARAWWQLHKPPDDETLDTLDEKEKDEGPKQHVRVDENDVVWVTTPQPQTPAAAARIEMKPPAAAAGGSSSPLSPPPPFTPPPRGAGGSTDDLPAALGAAAAAAPVPTASRCLDPALISAGSAPSVEGLGRDSDSLI